MHMCVCVQVHACVCASVCVCVCVSARTIVRAYVKFCVSMNVSMLANAPAVKCMCEHMRVKACISVSGRVCASESVCACG